MADEKSIKQQRDRFLAFSFASSDLLIEISPNGQVQYALGAAKGITGLEDANLIGRHWLDLFTKVDRPTLVALRSKARPVQRCGPILVTLDKSLGENRKAVLTGIRMPDDDRFYLTLGFTSVLLAKTGDILRISEETDLLDKDTFLHAACEAIDLARSLKQNIDLTLIDLSDVEAFKDRVGKSGWRKFTDTVGGLLRSKSVDGQSAAEVAEGRYSILHDKDIEAEGLRAQIEEIAREQDMEGVEVTVSSKTVTSDLQELSERETTKALIYTINEFQRRGTELTIKTLNNGFNAYVSANARKIAEFKQIISQLNFNMYFQPIVDLNNGYEAIHFEMLSRFLDGGSTLEWVMFGEDIGLAPDFDMAVLDRVINYLKYKSSGRRSKFAVNISGQSIQSDQFFDQLLDKLKAYKSLSERLMFEITESNQIRDLDKVGNFISVLRSEGFQMCLDDFGAGAASFQYLQALHVDYLKIDGQYTKRMLISDRDTAMVKNLVAMCRDLGIKVVAEMVETEEQVYRLRHIGCHYAQGYLFAKPGPKPEYTPPTKLSS
ncbi:MAG: EAL domain-containing protein [Alphaproteobacteria bacterium]|nr:EAL domain-containing protein [Alphaproteobacteria bacterium]